MYDDDALIIYTDGSSLPSPRRGGTGIRFVKINEIGNEVSEDIVSPFGYEGATNNQMELQAPITALKEALKRDLSPFSKILIKTDSQYVANNFKTAVFQWSQQRWLNRNGKPILNAVQWKELVKTVNKIYQQTGKRVEFEWVKGHAKDMHNKAVDKSAKKVAECRSTNRVSIVKARRKKFKETKADPGCVKMQGQRISIYIVNDQYLSIQKVYYYRYQVISIHSPFYKYTDFIYSEILLSAGHFYYGKFHKDDKNPRVIVKFREIMSPK